MIIIYSIKDFEINLVTSIFTSKLKQMYCTELFLIYDADEGHNINLMRAHDPNTGKYPWKVDTFGLAKSNNLIPNLDSRCRA